MQMLYALRSGTNVPHRTANVGKTNL